MLGLPSDVRACLFDLDGVLTQTATVHAAAWKQMFDEYLRARAARTGEPFVPFDPAADYGEYVDGKPRSDGVRSFLASREIELPEGEADDPPDRETVRGLGNRKNELVLRLIHEQGVEAYPGSVRYLEAVARRWPAAARWSRRAPTAATSWSPPESRSSSRRGSTAWSPSASTCTASRPPTPSWPAPGRSR